MITVNKVYDTISGVYGKGVQYSVPFNEETYKKMLELADAADNAQSVAELTQIITDFEALTKVDYNAYIETKVKHVYKHTDGNYYLKSNGVISSVPMPRALVFRLEESMDNNIDPTPLIKFWTRFLRNPKLRKLNKTNQRDFAERVFNYVDMKYHNEELADQLINEKGYSWEVARLMSTVDQVQISKEGLLKTFKVSKEITEKWVLDDEGNSKQVPMFDQKADIDPITGLVTYTTAEHTNEERWFKPAVMGDGGDAFMCSATGKLGHVIKVGAVHSITWDQINTNDNVSCVPGLHVGGIYYIKGYQNSGTETHNILVDPMNIGAVPDDETGAIRCVEYYVLDAFSGINGSIYHSSTYGAMTDKAWEDMRAEIIKQFGELKEAETTKIDTEIDEINSI